MIQVEHLTKRYGGHTAVDDISFTVEDGCIYGLLGPNGAGKSTTMNIITGYLSATDGTVTINGHDIAEEPAAAKACIGYLPEQPPLYQDMTVREYLLFVAELKGTRKKADRIAAVENACARTGLQEMEGRLIRNLSKGYRQRVGIAGALLGTPKVIILDEPTAGLDPKERIRFRNLISELAENRLVLLSTHIVSDVEYIADQILLMKDGSLVHHGTSQQLLAAAPTQVWTCTVPRAQADQLLHQYPVVNLKTLPQGVQLRVLSQTPPTPEAHPAEMTLEDLFLHYFGETAGETDAAL